ncbi:hypothetical protein JL720_4812 [Aureococcus anophagefferens]|nr:hypothetical protein JL720_4812 [Aureococcus anophagefferens]
MEAQQQEQQEQQENDESLTEEERKAKAARDNGFVLKAPLEELRVEAKTALTALQRYALNPASLSDAEAMDVIIRFTACACELGWGCGATIVTLVDYLKAKDNGDDDAAAAALEKMRRYVGVQNFLYSRDASAMVVPNILLEKMRLTCSLEACAKSFGRGGRAARDGCSAHTTRQNTCDIVAMQRAMGVSFCAVNAINDRGMDRKTFDQFCYNEDLTAAFGASTCYVYNIHNGGGAGVAASILHPKYLALDPRRPERAFVADVTGLFVRRVLLNPGNITVVEDAKGKATSPWTTVSSALGKSVYARLCYEQARKFIRVKTLEIQRELDTLTAGYFAELQRAIAFLLTRDEFQPRDAAEREQFAVVESYLANPLAGAKTKEKKRTKKANHSAAMLRHY